MTSFLLKKLARIWKLLPRDGRVFLARITQKKFTASVAGVITNEDGRVLVLDHVLRPASGWGLPGGFMKHFEQPVEALRREIREETGIELSEIELYRTRTLKRHIEFIFTARANGRGEVKSREITALEWFDPANLPPEMNVDQQFLIRKVFGLDL
ncbi:MAG TPA: NUDIX domain-containing protein [Pyrinomonadaceae bacterium]|nr:NUDIX domain-containing protein [Pyrinomonadaceae bacterium]